MGIFDELAKLGYKVAEDVKPESAKKLLDLIKQGKYGKTIVNPEVEQGLGKIIFKPETQGPVGDVLQALNGKTTLTEMKQAKAQQDVMRKEAFQDMLNKAKAKEPKNLEQLKLENSTPIPGESNQRMYNPREWQNTADEIMNKRNAAGMALGLPIAGQNTQVDMNPLPDIKAGYEAYKGLKEKLYDKLAGQLDLTPDKSTKEQLKGAMDITLDPLNAAVGPVGMGLGALQMGLEAIPSEKESRFDKLKQMLGRKPAGEDLP